MNEWNFDNSNVGNEMYGLIKKLFPICRSITGNGVRQTLEILNDYLPELKVYEVPTNTKVFDWTIPKEWNINDAYIENEKGGKIIDFKNSNLHVLNYSIPVDKIISLDELKEHIYTDPKNPDSIPYRTSYYKEDWGFCMSHSQFKNLNDGKYRIKIDSTLKDGVLTYGELFIRGQTEEEILFSCYICHPSMCNDNLSGVVLLTSLANSIKSLDLRYSYRFLFIPETIGAITWLAKNKDNVSKIKFGLVATCLGDAGNSTYKKTKEGNNILDKIVEKILVDSHSPFKIVDFFPTGSDERQFSSPGFNLPVGSLMRSVYTTFPEYHTSNDDLDFVKSQYLSDSFEKYLKIIFVLEKNQTFINQYPYCEPQLGNKGLYNTKGGFQKNQIQKNAINWILNFSDGKNSLLDIAIRSGINFEEINFAKEKLVESKLLKLSE
jgi:aminopeptidase-like protein